ncbi:MAG: PAS domain S-box protein, partial [Pseudomonadota bacterium]
MTGKLDGERFAAGGLSRAILDSAHALVVTLDVEGRIAGFNRACEILTGYEADEVIGTHIWDKLLPEEVIEPIRRFVAGLREGGEIPEEYENAWVTRDGRRPIISWNNSVLRDASGEIELVVGIGVDVTERREAADRLSETAASLARAQQTAKIGNWEWTIATGQEYWSDQMYRNFGLEPGSIEATDDNFYEHVHPDDREGVRRTLQATIDTGKPYSFDFRVVWPDGTERLVHEEGEALLGGNGETVGLAGTMQDVTELRASENHLRRLTL